MSHEIEIVDGKASMVYAGKTPWHGLGTEIPSDLSPVQVLQAASLDWEVEKRDMYTELNGEMVVIPDRKALFRTSDDKMLDIVSEAWNPLQNTTAFEFFDDFVSSGDMDMHTAGSLDGGRLVWALAKIKESFEVTKGDVVEQFLLFSNPHRYGQGIDVRTTPIRVVCNNTHSFALKTVSANMVKINHRRVFNPDTVKLMLGVAQNKLDTYKEAARFLASKSYTAESIVAYFKDTYPRAESSKNREPSRNASLALELVETQPGAEFAPGSWWNAYNSVTYMTDHIVGRSDNNRLKSAWYGGGHKKKTEALARALEMAE